MAAINMRANFSTLPRDLIITILLKLPFKAILGCKLVCKQWFDIVTSDPIFAKTHYDHENNSLALVYPKMIADGYKNRSNNKRGWFDMFDGIVTLDGSWDEFDLINSCKGFLLMRERAWGWDSRPDLRPYVIYNPLTNETVYLPNRPRVESYHGCNSCGLGFSPLTKQLKVVMFAYDRKVCTYNLLVYTHGNRATSVWRTVSRIPKNRSHIFENNILNKPIEVNGILYWIARSKRSIVCFDVEKEELGEVSTPFNSSNSGKYLSSIGVYSGLLCLGITSWGNNQFFQVEMWVMKEYEINDSWMQIINAREAFTNDVDSAVFMKIERPKLVKILDTQERIFMTMGRGRWGKYHLFSYDPNKKRFEELPFPEINCLEMTIDLYTPSFFSLRYFLN